MWRGDLREASSTHLGVAEVCFLHYWHELGHGAGGDMACMWQAYYLHRVVQLMKGIAMSSLQNEK